MNPLEESLIRNHLAFLASHRGAIRRLGDTFFIDSDRPEFKYALLGQMTPIDALPVETQTVQLFPWSRITAKDLLEAGYTSTLGVSYMILNENLTLEANKQNSLVIREVKSSAEMDHFSEVQARGFNETEEGYLHWHPWLKEANDRNLQNNLQAFYVGFLDEKPACTALTVFDGESAGIYAVATLPYYRKRNLSTMMMQRVLAEAKNRGAKIVTLQVIQDSYVEQFYQNLGFTRLFTTNFYRRR